MERGSVPGKSDGIVAHLGLPRDHTHCTPKFGQGQPSPFVCIHPRFLHAQLTARWVTRTPS